MVTTPLLAGQAKDSQLYEALKQMRDSINGSGGNPGVVSGILPVRRGGTGTAVGSITGPESLAYAAGGSAGNVCLVPAGTGRIGLGGLGPSLFAIQAYGHTGPSRNYRYDLGERFTRWRTLWANELQVQTLVAEEVLATIGGRILVGPTTKLAADLTAVATTISVEHNEAESGDIVYLQTAPGGIQQTEFMRVASTYSGTGPYTYTVARAIDGSPANAWLAGDAVFNTGKPTDGFIDLYSQHGIRGVGETGPSIVGNERDTTTFDGWTPRWAVGNLKGIYGYTTDLYGAAFGVPSQAWIKIDPTNGVRIGHGTSAPKAWIKADGSAVFTGQINIETGGNAATTAQVNAASDAAADAQADADAANALIGDMSSDNILSPVEKPALIKEVTEIENEKPGIYGATLSGRNPTQKTAYGDAYTALVTTYLPTLTAPVAWDNTAGNTTIVGATFRGKFTDYYAKRQLLLDANVETARADAATAQSAADTAHGLADDAQVSADAALGLITDMASDNILSPVEKPALIKEVAIINGEYAGIYGSALSTANATLRDAYKTDYDILVAYLALLVPPAVTTAWNVTTGNTEISGSYFRARFTYYYARRQDLLNANAATATSKGYLLGSYGIPGMLEPPSTSSAGLFLGWDHLGFYKGTAGWKTYMNNLGDFYLAGPEGSTHGLTWNHDYLGYGSAKLSITGIVTVGSVTLDDAGLTIATGSAATQAQTYGFKYGSTYLGGLASFYASSTYNYNLGSLGSLTGHVYTTIGSYASLSGTVQLIASSSGGGTGNAGSLTLVGSSGTNGWADFDGVGLFVKDKGLKVGYDHTSGIPSAGTILASGAITAEGALNANGALNTWSSVYVNGDPPNNIRKIFLKYQDTDNWIGYEYALNGADGPTITGYLGVQIYSEYANDQSHFPYLAWFNDGNIDMYRSVNIASTYGLRNNNVQVVGAQGAAVADATNSSDVITQFNLLLSRLRSTTGHGLIAT